MKKLLQTFSFSLSLALIATIGIPGLAAAHIHKQDNGISGELHIPPEDKPQAHQPTELDIVFGDAANKFSLPDCNCQLSVKQNGRVRQTVQLQPYTSGATFDSKATVQFPAAGVYEVVVQGSAKDGMFQAFQLDYSVSVAANSADITSAPHKRTALLVIAAGSLIILIMVAYSVAQKPRKNKLKS
jgi:hypothetical protein